MNAKQRFCTWPQGSLLNTTVRPVPPDPRKFHVGDRVVASWVGIIGTVTKEQVIDAGLSSRPHYRIFVECDPGSRYVALEGAEYNFEPWEDERS